MKRAINTIYHFTGGALAFLGLLVTFYGTAMVDTADISLGIRYAVCGLCMAACGAFLVNWKV